MAKKLFSPVLLKELYQTASQRQNLILRIIYLMLLFGFTWVLVKGRQGYYFSHGRRLFLTMAAIQTITVLIITPILMSGCIAGEREKNTMSLLFLTQLTPRNIVLDKTLSHLFHIFLFAALATPFQFVGFMLGGVDIQDIVTVSCMVLAAGTYMAGLSLFISTVRRTFTSALISTYVYAFCSGILVVALIAGLDVFEIRYMLPRHILGLKIDNDQWLLGFLLVASLVAFLFFIAMAVRAVGRLARNISQPTILPGPGESAPPINRWRSFSRIELRFPATRMVPWLHIRELFEPHVNACRRHKKLIIGILVFCFGYIGFSSEIRTWPATYFIFAFITAVIVSFMTVLKSATCFAQERDLNRFKIFLTTAIPGARIVTCAYLSNLAVLVPLWLLPGTFLLVGKVLAPYDRYGDYYSLAPVLLLPLYLHTVLAIGMYISLRSRTRIRAIIWSMGLAGLLVLGPYLLAIIFDVLNIYELRRLHNYSPLVPLWYSARQDEFWEWLMEYPSAAVLHGFFSIVIPVYLLTAMGIRFNKIVRRQPDSSLLHIYHRKQFHKHHDAEK